MNEQEQEKNIPQEDDPLQENKKDKHQEKHHHIKLSEQLEKTAAEKDQLMEKLQRVSADYLNYQKRTAKQIAEAICYEKETILKSILPVLDNFEHTIAGAEKIDNADDIRKAVRIIYDQMLAILKNHGVEQLDAAGKKFDPVSHQALIQKAEPEKEDMIVLEEFQKGYRLGEKILRPSRVIVNKLPAAEETKSEQGNSQSGEQ